MSQIFIKALSFTQGCKQTEKGNSIVKKIFLKLTKEKHVLYKILRKKVFFLQI